jgi:prepilin-type N-terminal cleavage/methylation domain-containing protein
LPSAATVQHPKSRSQSAFTLLEILLSLALVAMLLVAMNTFVFSMGELWGKNTDVRLFEQHVRAVTRALERELRAATLPPAARANASPVAPQEILPAGTRLITWPGPALPEVVCSLQARPQEGLVLLWHSRLETRFDSDPPRETVLTPFVTALAYDYYDAALMRWTTEPVIKKENNGQATAPQRLRLKFAHGKLTRETVVALGNTPQGLPNF